MKKLAFALVGLVGFAVAGISTSSLTTINPEATWGAWEAWKPSEEMHHYLHGVYQSSMGSHGLDVKSLQLHEDLHGWERGLVTESEVAATWSALSVDLVTFRNNVKALGILNTGVDPRFEEIYGRLIAAYKTLRVQMANVKP